MRLPLVFSLGCIAAVLSSLTSTAVADEPAKCHVVQGVSSSWQWCENSITRMSPEERAKLTVHHPIEFGGKPETGPTSWKWRGNPAGDPNQAAFDWHNLQGVNWMTPARSQGGCGSCFVFGSLGAMEGMFKYIAGDPKLDIDLSEQSVISCISFGSCASGGTAEEVGMRLKSDGVPDEACYPYTATEGDCAKVCTDWQDRRAFITDWHMSVLPWSDADIKAELVYEPVIVNMQVYSDFDGYKSGVYSRSPNATATGWHVVTIVGWDDSDNSWIVRNSWGDDFGMNGYFKMSRESDCNIVFSGVCFATHLNYFDVGFQDMPGLPCLGQHDVKMTAVKGQKAKKSVDINNCGALYPFLIKYLFTPKVDWMALTANDPNLDPGESTQINLTADSTNLPVGVHKTVLKVFGGSGNNTVNVEFTVTDPGTGPKDSGVDAPEPGKDGSVPPQDGSQPGKDSASGPDAATGDEPTADAGLEPVGNTAAPLTEDDGGCGCRTNASGSSSGWGLLAIGLAALLRRRRA
ncbi:MAG: hypothetical protein HY898_36690 [Deltaproteobacteria bacterium]|nr:hypothetical protein [Deltaproteobacteria bacterium]